MCVKFYSHEEDGNERNTQNTHIEPPLATVFRSVTDAPVVTFWWCGSTPPFYSHRHKNHPSWTLVEETRISLSLSFYFTPLGLFTHTQLYSRSLHSLTKCILVLLCSFALRSLRIASVGNIMECDEKRKRGNLGRGSIVLLSWIEVRGSGETTVDPWSRFIENVRLQRLKCAQNVS